MLIWLAPQCTENGRRCPSPQERADQGLQAYGRSTSCIHNKIHSSGVQHIGSLHRDILVLIIEWNLDKRQRSADRLLCRAGAAERNLAGLTLALVIPKCKANTQPLSTRETTWLMHLSYVGNLVGSSCCLVTIPHGICRRCRIFLSKY